MSPEAWAAVIAAAGVPVSLAAIFISWASGRRAEKAAARAEAMTNFRWAVEQIGHVEQAQREAGWVMLQAIITDPSLTGDQRRMMDAAMRRLRAARGLTP